MGHEVECVTNGREALDALRPRGGVPARGFDLVLMDVHMPEMDGLAATRRIRALGHGGDGRGPGTVPVIAMTANAMKDDRAACLAAGMDDYLPKPFDNEELERVLTHWSGQRSRAGGASLS
jgi:CheY-like chemotaxis protein